MIHLIGLYVYFTFPPAFLLLAVLVLPLPLFMRKLVVRLADAVLFFHVRLGSLRLTMFHLLQLFSTLTFVWMWMYVLRCVVFVGVWAVHSVCLCACFVCVCNLRDYTCVCVCVCCAVAVRAGRGTTPTTSTTPCRWAPAGSMHCSPSSGRSETFGSACFP